MTPESNTPLTRRQFVRSTAGAVASTQLLPSCLNAAESAAKPGKAFRLWAMGDAHVGSDITHKRESLADAIRQSEQGGKNGAPGFDWDIAINAGDFSGSQTPPVDHEGREVVRQYAAATKHRREDFYDLAGNHDASGPDEETQWWFRKWIDPTGENTKFSGVDPKRRRYPVTGEWDHYSFCVGNVLFLIMSDRNDGGPPVGRGKKGGYPAGAVTGETFEWWKKNVEANRDKIIISAHHHMLRETTVGSGDWEGFTKKPDGTLVSRYHGDQGGSSSEGASYLYFVDGKPKAMAFEKYLEAHPGAIDLWIGGHTHTNPDDKLNGRTHIERKWGATFINCCALTRFHGVEHSRPMSRLVTFADGSDEARGQCYLHTSDHAPQGWYEKAERTIKLGKSFKI